MKTKAILKSILTALLLTPTASFATDGTAGGGGGGNSGVVIARSSRSVPTGLDRFHQLLWMFQNGSKPKLNSLETHQGCNSFSTRAEGVIHAGRVKSDVRKNSNSGKCIGIALATSTLGDLAGEARGMTLDQALPRSFDRYATDAEYEAYYESVRQRFESQLPDEKPYSDFFKNRQCGAFVLQYRPADGWPQVLCRMQYLVQDRTSTSLDVVLDEATAIAPGGRSLVETEQSFIFNTYPVNGIYRDIELRSYNGLLIGIDREDQYGCGDTNDAGDIFMETRAVDGVCRIVYFTKKQVIKK